MSISASLQALTGSFQDNGVNATFALLSGGFDGIGGSDVGQIVVSLEALTGDFTSPGNLDGSIAARLEALEVVSFTEPNTVASSLQASSGSFTGLQGVIGTVDGVLATLSAALTGDTAVLASVTSSFQALTGAFAGDVLRTGTFVASTRALRGAFVGVLGEVGVLAGRTELVAATLTGALATTGAVSAALRAPWAYFSGEHAIGAALETWVVNTRSNAVTRYPAYPVNSFARYNGTYLGAGPNGLFLLDVPGNADTGVPVAWTVATGLMDDKKASLKRLTEVLLGIRYDDTVRVRVWVNDAKYYDYVLPNITPDVIQQVRAKVGKKLRSRYFKIEVSGMGLLELDSLQATMPETSRRVG